MKHDINIIGAGRLGQTLGRLYVQHHLANIGGVYNRSPQSTQDAVAFIGDGICCTDINDLPSAPLTLITTPDDHIPQTCDALSKTRHLVSGSVVIHCSGSLTSDALLSVKERGCFVASIHPMRSFARPELSITDYEGTYCAMEGDPEALALVKPLFDQIGSITYRIHKEKKALYHAAGVFASNYIITLSHQAQHCLHAAGIDDPLAMQMIASMIQHTAHNLQATNSPTQALTGPIQRGDISTLQSHLASLPNEGLKNLYAQLGLATLPLTQLDTDVVALIKNTFQGL